MKAAILTLFCAVLALLPAQVRPDDSTGIAAEHFIIIGVDGLSVAGVANTRSSHMHALMERGAWTLRARGVMPTLSSPNWASMIMGAGPEQHGVTSNGYFTNMFEIQPVCRDAAGLFPTIFEVLRSTRPTSKIAVFHDWGGFSHLVESNVPDVIRHEKGAAHTVAAAVKYWRAEQPTLMFIHLDNVDHTGHDSGWQGREYYRAVEEADGYIGQVIDMLEETRRFDRTLVLVSSDHGGKGHGHGKNSLIEIQIPWILAGAGVRPGELQQPVNTFDTAATVAWAFGLQPPDCWVGRPVLSAFRAGGVRSARKPPAEDDGSRSCPPSLPVQLTGAWGPAAAR
jgi:predicted AlkP superfamily pyrophosphatase or phosphodiesterase